jgi:hypothetical protein
MAPRKTQIEEQKIRLKAGDSRARFVEIPTFPDDDHVGVPGQVIPHLPPCDRLVIHDQNAHHVSPPQGQIAGSATRIAADFLPSSLRYATSSHLSGGRSAIV